MRRWVPLIATLQGYRADWLVKDLVAGMALTAILLPAGMGYAQAAGLPGICGLYATIVPLIVYALLGPSRILVLGPDSALIALIAATVLPLAAGDPGRAVALAGMLAILSGLFCILAGIARFGFITDLFSKPIRFGYLNGIALTLMISQLPKVMGFTVSGQTLTGVAPGLVQGLQAGRINLTACAIGVTCLALILGFGRFIPRVPGVLIALVGATAVASLFDLADQAGIAVVGPLPQGLPSFAIPAVSLHEVGAMVAGAVAIALVSFSDMSVLSRTYALRGGYRADSNQELVALGVANLLSGLFQGFAVSSSTSRTPVAEAAGARTQLTGLVGALCVALLLICGPTLLQDLPQAALGAIVIAACFSLVEVAGVVRLYRMRRSEFVLSIVCFLSVALVGVIQGMFIAVGLALLAFIWRAWRPHDAVLGRIDGIKGYHDLARHPEARQVPGLVLFRWDAPLFFANAAIFQERVLQAVAAAPTPTRWVVVAAEPVTDVDTTAADSLAELNAELQRAGIELRFAEMKGPVKDRLRRYGLFDTIGTESFFPTIGRAVARYRETYEVDWVDWDEPPGGALPPPA
jgi:high affinity sulfate transporter 1